PVAPVGPYATLFRSKPVDAFPGSIIMLSGGSISGPTLQSIRQEVHIQVPVQIIIEEYSLCRVGRIIKSQLVGLVLEHWDAIFIEDRKSTRLNSSHVK